MQVNVLFPGESVLLPCNMRMNESGEMARQEEKGRLRRLSHTQDSKVVEGRNMFYVDSATSNAPCGRTKVEELGVTWIAG